MEIVEEYRPGAIGAITSLHARYYSRHWNFGLYFEAKVATDVAEFLSRYDERTDRLWLALDGGDIVGSIVIDGGEPEAARLGAHVRHFIVDERLRGQNVGRDLLRRALEFCDGVPYARSYLTTFAGLDAARRLYERAGYRLVDEADDMTWGTTVREQLYERLHPAPDRLT